MNSGKPGFRDVLRALEDAGELLRVPRPVDPRHLSGLAAQARQATLFESIAGYPGWRVAGALVSTRKRLALAMGCSERDIATRFEEGAGCSSRIRTEAEYGAARVGEGARATERGKRGLAVTTTHCR